MTHRLSIICMTFCGLLTTFGTTFASDIIHHAHSETEAETVLHTAQVRESPSFVNVNPQNIAQIPQSRDSGDN